MILACDIECCCDDCNNSDVACEFDCDYQDACQGCREMREAQEEADFEIACIQGRV